MLYRYYLDKIKEFLKPNKVLVIYGPRQVGKTTLIQNFLKDFQGKIYNSTGENESLKKLLNSGDFSKIIPFFKGYDLIFIDEAQKIPSIGEGLKILVDQIPGIKIIATGSSSFSLANKVGEPLVGRQHLLHLFPISLIELDEDLGRGYIEENLNNLMVYGTYPEVLTKESFIEKSTYLQQIKDSYLFKDILELESIKNSRVILDLLQLLAYQIGKEVSLSELATNVQMDRKTVARYLDLLEKSFVIINLRGFSRNLRKEITKTSRYYFYDNGIRNAVINNFNDVDSRNDIGQLWENFLFIERLKKQSYHNIYSNNFFWRTWDQDEIDLIEQRDGKLYGYEFKYSSKKQPKAPKLWVNTYKESSFEVITRDNYTSFVI
jgi:predicted AAA+ superfamily ATPase